MTNPPPSPAPARQTKPTDETIKETFESIVIAFILAFVFRAYVVEAFVIPTGSMAPTLLGEHVRTTCKQCGYTFTLSLPKQDRGIETTAVCPMCHYDNKISPHTTTRSGDRILVEKFIYDFSKPKRWDVIVFKYPDGPRINYIKRLVGLPDEKLLIFDGNLYVKPDHAKHWHIARKTDRPKVQNAVWQPIYDSQFIPLDQGLSRRGRQYQWATPWIAEHPADWKIANRRNYRHDSAQPGHIHFSFKQGNDDAGLTLNPYNELLPEFNGNEPIEDIKLAAAFTPDKPGLAVQLTTTARLNKPLVPAQPISARIDAQGHVTIAKTNPKTGKVTTLAKSSGTYPFVAGHTTRVQFWFVDQQASVWINGQRVAQWSFEIPMDELIHRVRPALRPDVSISVSGSPVTLHRVDLARDLYYTDTSGGQRGRGTLVRSGNVATGTPVTLGDNQFFCLGDNSPVSDDGRFWQDVNPWIKQRDFGGAMRPGIVPRRLIVGKAFFVYLPAPFPLLHNRVTIVPNFNDMRFIH